MRARRSLSAGTPAATVTREKQRKVILAARDWLASAGAGERALRFDVVAVHLAPRGPTCVHLPAAFDLADVEG